MKTEYIFSESLKSLLGAYPLMDITVGLLCDKAKKSRQTFYYHFRDIYDLIEWIFLNEKVERFINKTSIKDLEIELLKYYHENEAFILAIIKTAGRELLQGFLFNIFYQTNTKFIAREDIGGIVPIKDRREFASFYASAFSESFIRHFESGGKDPEIFIRKLSEISGDYVRNYITKVKQ